MPPGAALGIGAGISGIGSVAGGIIGGNAAKSAAETQADAARYASDQQYKMYQQQREDQQPWRQAGVAALSQLADKDYMRDFGAADFQQDPGYQFRMQEGQKALERSASARGGLFSGGTLKALSKYGQDYASNEYQNAYNRFNADRDRRFNRLSSLAGIGQTANTQLANAGMNYANQVGANSMGAANAAGAAGIAGANAWGQGISGLGSAINGYGIMSSLMPRAQSQGLTFDNAQPSTLGALAGGYKGAGLYGWGG